MISEYERGCIDEQERILVVIRDALKSWGHKNAQDCNVCNIVNNMLINEIKKDPK